MASPRHSRIHAFSGVAAITGEEMPKRQYQGRSDVLPFDTATDLQHRIARSFSLVTDWMGALTGQYDLADVLTTIARQTQAANVGLYRLDMPRGRVTPILSHDRLADRNRPLVVTGALARFVLARTTGPLQNGQIWRLSEVRILPGFAGSDAEREWRERSDNFEVSLILLEASDNRFDLLELSFETAPPRSPELPSSIIATALSDVWRMRTPGVIARIIAQSSRRKSAPHLEGAALLSADNPYALTQAEMRVCSHLSNGLAPKSIAQTLGLSVATVRTHLRNLYSKTGTDGQVSLIALARNGTVDDD